MTNLTLPKIAFYLLLLVYPLANLSANETGQQELLTVNGFYTFDLSYANGLIDVVSNGNVPRLLEKHDATLNNSVAGMQLELNVTPDLSAFLQASAFYDENDDFDESLDWAYLRYDLGNDLDIRLGRFLIPFLQGTELKSIGYSRLWARPLVPGSGAGGFVENEGVELFKRMPLDDNFLSLQFVVAESTHHDQTVDGDLLGLVALNYEWENAWLRAAYARVNYQANTPSGQVIDENASAGMISVETEFRLMDLLINAGLSDTQAEFTPDDSLAYLSIAYPLESITPYILVTRTNQEFEAFSESIPPPPGPPPLGAPPPQRVGNNECEALSVGFRYDLDGPYAIKTQWDRIEKSDDSIPSIGRVENHADVFTILLEGVF